MNKKVLTLCAGFLLAGGMLSSLSAEKLSAVADNGKYYKIVRGAYITGGTTWTAATDQYYIDLDAEGEAGIVQDFDDYWKVVKVENGYQLINLQGTPLTVDGKTVFTFKEDLAAPASDYSQLNNGDWVTQGMSVDGKFYPFVKQELDLSKTPGLAFPDFVTRKTSFLYMPYN